MPSLHDALFAEGAASELLAAHGEHAPGGAGPDPAAVVLVAPAGGGERPYAALVGDLTSDEDVAGVEMMGSRPGRTERVEATLYASPTPEVTDRWTARVPRYGLPDFDVESVRRGDGYVKLTLTRELVARLERRGYAN